MTMINSQITFTQKEREPNSVSGSAAAIAAGTGASLINYPIGKLSIGLAKDTAHMPGENAKIIHMAAEDILKEQGLDRKGVRIIPLEESLKKSLPPKSFLEKIGLSNPIREVIEGKNCYYLTKDLKGTIFEKNTILVPEKELAPAVFHEIGHSMNNNLSSIGKFLQKIRPVSFFAPAILLLYGACSKKSGSNDDKDLSCGQKINNFIRNNAGKLALISTLPMLIEEGMATYKGEKLAKQKLPKYLNTIKKTNRYTYLSYVGFAVSSALSAWAAVKIKDAITNQSILNNNKDVKYVEIKER